MSDTSPERLFGDPELLKKADLEISDFLLALENFKDKIPSKFTNVLKLSDLLSQLESD